MKQIGALPLVLLADLCVADEPGPRADLRRLWVHPTNPLYFTDGTKNPDGSCNAFYLTGSHTWANLIDRGTSDPPPAFDFDA